MMSKNTSKIVFIALSLFLFTMIYNQENSNQGQEGESQGSDSQRAPAQDASFMSTSTGVSATQPTPTQEGDTTSIEPHENDPIHQVFKKFKMTVHHPSILVNEERWFVSDRLVQIPLSDSPESKGEVLQIQNNFAVVELFDSAMKQDYPPLVISHSTHQPIPITGDLLVKYSEGASALNDLVDFLQNDAGLQRYIGALQVNADLSDVRRILIQTKYRNKVIELYKELSKVKGENQIEAVEFDIRHQFKTI